jgi:hypothetical protein
MASGIEKYIPRINEACRPGGRRTWSVWADLKLSRLDNGRVRLYFPDHNSALYRALRAHVQDMVKDGDARDARDGGMEDPLGIQLYASLRE